VILSLNEVDATAKKAARGAGYPWGLAEDAARATRWLCAQGMDGCAALAEVLLRVDGQVAACAPERGPDGWSGSGPVCPIQMAAALADFAQDLAAGPVTVTGVMEPRLLLPGVSMIHQITGTPLAVLWDDGIAHVAEGVAIDGPMAQGDTPLTIAFANEHVPSQSITRATPTDAAWTILTTFAHRTYAPATEASRLKGAGAGLSDND
jgi:hypothetical protein